MQNNYKSYKKSIISALCAAFISIQVLYAQETPSKHELGLIHSSDLYLVHILYKGPLNFEKDRYFKAHFGINKPAEYHSFQLKTGFGWENRKPVWNNNAFYYGLALGFQYRFYDPRDYIKSRYFYSTVGYNCGFRFILFKKVALAFEIQPSIVTGISVKYLEDGKLIESMPAYLYFARQISLGIVF